MKSESIIKLLLAVGFVMLLALILTHEKKNFNNGVCIKCETEYEAVGVTRQGQIAYICPNCHFRTYHY